MRPKRDLASEIVKREKVEGDLDFARRDQKRISAEKAGLEELIKSIQKAMAASRLAERRLQDQLQTQNEQFLEVCRRTEILTERLFESERMGLPEPPETTLRQLSPVNSTGESEISQPDDLEDTGGLSAPNAQTNEISRLLDIVTTFKQDVTVLQKESNRTAGLVKELSNQGDEEVFVLRENPDEADTAGLEKSGALSYAATPFSDALIKNPEDEEREWDSNADPAGKEERDFMTSARLRGFIAVIVLVGILGFAYLRFFLPDGGSESRMAAMENQEQLSNIRFSDFLENSTYGELRAESIDLSRGFMEAGSLDEATQFILGGRERLPALQEFYGRSEESFPKGFKSVKKVIPNALAGIFYFIVFASDLEDQIHQLIVVPAGEKMLIDWACSVGYGPMSVEKFFETKPTTPVRFRFFVGRDLPRIAKNSSLMSFPFYIEGLERSLRETPRFFRLTDTEEEESFYARISPSAARAMGLYYRLSWTSETVPVQLQLVWNQDLGYPEVVEVKRFWWFDYEFVDVLGEQSVQDALATQRTDEFGLSR